MGRWVRPEVYPLLGAMGFVTSMVVFQLTRNALLNPDCRLVSIQSILIVFF
ncbi:BnaC07g49150D, partial [Brassica napus]